jgi:hypothetical protein
VELAAIRGAGERRSRPSGRTFRRTKVVRLFLGLKARATSVAWRGQKRLAGSGRIVKCVASGQCALLLRAPATMRDTAAV